MYVCTVESGTVILYGIWCGTCGNSHTLIHVYCIGSQLVPITALSTGNYIAWQIPPQQISLYSLQTP